MALNGQVEEITALEIWLDAATEVFIVPSQVNTTSLVPPVKPPPGSIMVKLLPVVVKAKACVAPKPIHRINEAKTMNRLPH
jgi:hypothetical protein